jgi:predicted permease
VPFQPGLTLLRDAREDLRHALRLFARRPAVSLLSVAGLAIGLGIATVAIGVLNAAVLRDEGLVDPDRAPAVLRTTARSVVTSWGFDEFLHLRDAATRLRLEAMTTDTALVRTTSEAPVDASTPVAFVTGGFFAATGGRMIVGRSLGLADERLAGPPPAVISFTFWTSRLHADPGALGRTIHVGGTPATVVGIAQPGFTVPHRRSLWLPVTAHGAVYGSHRDRRAPDIEVEVFGRLSPGTSLEEAEAELGVVTASLPRADTDGDPIRARLDSEVGLGRSPGTDTVAITAFIAVVIAFVLLVSWANVASVLVAAAIVRERELGVRVALGASRGRLARQLVTEGLLLASGGAILGLGLARVCTPVIASMIEAPAGTDLAPDALVYACLTILTLGIGVGAGLAPAWHVRRAFLPTLLRADLARGTTARPARLRATLVAMQAAASMLLLVMATLFVRAAFRAAAVDVGFDATGLYAVVPRTVPVTPGGDGSVGASLARALSELPATPGVTAVTLAELVPFGDETRTSVTGDGEEGVVVHFNRTGAEYFDLVGLRLLSGRPYTRDDVAAEAPVAVVSHSLARAFWPDRSPLGELLPARIPVATARPVVVGVVSDAIGGRLHERNTFAVYEPLGPSSAAHARLLIRVATHTPGVLAEVRQRLRAIDPNADVRIESIADRLRQEASRPRMLATLTGIVGGVALVLCAIGLSGLTSSVVGQRLHEMGVRVAMGASPAALWRLVMRESLRPVALGLGLGAGAALAIGHVVAAVFFGVSSRDPMTHLGAATLLVTAAVLAVMPSVRRAARVDAATILRQP